MKKLVVLASLAFALATMPSVPQRAYACSTSACAADESTATQVPAATDQSGKTQTACSTGACARPDNASEPAAAKGDRLDRGVQQACPTPTCATTEEQKATQTTGCNTGNCATPEGDHPARSVASLSPAGAALSKAARAIKERIRQQRTACTSPQC